jgi:hypothetical protein
MLQPLVADTKAVFRKPWTHTDASSTYDVSPTGTDRSSLLSPIWQTPVLVGSIAPGWTVIQPIPLTLHRESDGYCVISDDLFTVYGDARTPGEALEDYIVALIEYYELLAESAENHPPTQTLFHHLRQYLRTAAE